MKLYISVYPLLFCRLGSDTFGLRIASPYEECIFNRRAAMSNWKVHGESKSRN